MGNSTCANLLMGKGMAVPAMKFTEMKLRLGQECNTAYDDIT